MDMPVNEAMARVLEGLVQRPLSENFLPDVEGLDRDDMLLVVEELIARGWIAAQAQNRGDGRLYSVWGARITEAGERALNDLRRQLALSSNSENRSAGRSVAEKRSMRLAFMDRLYEVTDGAEAAVADMSEIGEMLGWNRAETGAVVEYLEGEQLLRFITAEGGLGITHRGVVEVEQSRTHPDEATDHFPPAANILYVEKMYGSQIQQGTVDSVQTQSISDATKDAIREYLLGVRSIVDDLELSEEDRSELDVELQTAELQLSSPRPRLDAIKSSLRHVGSVLERSTVMAGSAVELAHYIERLHQILPGV